MAQATYQWVIEKRILLLTLSGDYDGDEMRAEIPRFEKFLQEGIPPMYLIIDQTRITSLPKNFREPVNVMQPLSKKYPMAWTLLITGNPLFRFFGVMISHAFGVKFRPVGNLQGALEVIKRVDQELAPQISTIVSTTSGDL